MTLYACINGYQDGPLLAECLESIRQNVPDARICYVDGAYSRFVEKAKQLSAVCISGGREDYARSYLKFSGPQSDDETFQILEQYKVENVILCPRNKDGNPIPWDNEYVKRSAYFIGREGDWYFIVDTDERVVGKFPDTATLAAAKNWCVSLRRDDGCSPYPVMRVHQHVDGMKYEGAHHALWENGTLIRLKDIEHDWTIKGFELYHRWQHRANLNPIRHRIKGEYYRALLEKDETETRAKYGI